MIEKEVLSSLPDIFWENLRRELSTVFGMSLAEEEDFILGIYETIGFEKALKNACQKSDCLWLVNKNKDIRFDIEEFVVRQLIERKLLTLYSVSDIANQSKYEEILWCEYCNKYFPPQDMWRIMLEKDNLCNVCLKCAKNIK